MIPLTIFCRDFWETTVGCSWYFDAVVKLCVYGEHTNISPIIKNWIILYCNSSVLIGLAAMVYEPFYHNREIALGLSRSCSATFEQLFGFGATFSPSSNFSDFEHFFPF